MKRVANKDIHITRHKVDGFTLSCTVNNRDYDMRYIFYTEREARRHFKEYVHTQMLKEVAGLYVSELTRNDVLMQALRCICGGDTGTARELLGNN